MKQRCVECGKEIVGKPHNEEGWLGAWCSQECQAATDKIRQDAWVKRCGGQIDGREDDAK